MKHRVHCRSGALYDILIDRTTPWGNPFVKGRDGTRDEVVAKYAGWIRTQPQLLAKLPELVGKILGCWCTPSQNCHGDVLLMLLEELEVRTATQK